MRRLIVILCILLFFSCGEKRTVTPSIYYWKTVYRPGEYEMDRLQDMRCNSIYLRLFDVDLDEQTGRPRPVGSLRFRDSIEKGFSYIPVVFITQQAIAKLRPEAVGALAGNISSLIESYCNNYGIKAGEVQIDCDWTARSKTQYFALLEALKKEAFLKSKTLSCTIRLYQLKYISKNGIPPVDRGMLMCYNMGNIRQPWIKNSIIDYEVAEPYLKNMNTYPLPLDIALPLFDWPLLFRNNKLKGILRDISVEEIKTQSFLKKDKSYSYICTIDTFWKGYYLQKNDRIRPEDSDYEEIESIAGYTSRRLNNKNMRLAFFHCDSVTLSKYSPHEMETLINIYR